MSVTFVITPNFQLSGGWPDRLRVAEGDGWRAPSDAELAGLVVEAPQIDSAMSLFVVPEHLRSRFWAMLSEQAAEGTGDFVAFAEEMREFLVFKELPPPGDAVFELLIQDTGGEVDAAGLWALVNLGEEPVMLGWPGVRLRLSPGEGSRTAANLAPDVLPPAEEPNVLVAIRSGVVAQDLLLDG